MTDWRSLLPQGFLQATAQGAENLPQRAEGLAQEVLQGFQKKGLSQNHGDIRRWKEKKMFSNVAFCPKQKGQLACRFHQHHISSIFLLFCYSSIFLSDSFISALLTFPVAAAGDNLSPR